MKRSKLRKSDIVNNSVAEHLQIIDANQLITCQNMIEELEMKCKEEKQDVKERFIRLLRPKIHQMSELVFSVPNFWVKLLSNHPILKSLTSNGEAFNILQFLWKIDAEGPTEESDSCKIYFYFKENPYIENMYLVKSVVAVRDDEGTYYVAKSTPIKWKSESNALREQRVQENHFFKWFMDDNSGQLYFKEFFILLQDPISYHPLIEQFYDEKNSCEEEEEGSFRKFVEGKDVSHELESSDEEDGKGTKIVVVAEVHDQEPWRPFTQETKENLLKEREAARKVIRNPTSICDYDEIVEVEKNNSDEKSSKDNNPMTEYSYIN